MIFINLLYMNIILFDGVCNLCNSTVNFLIKYDKKDILHFAALQTTVSEKIIKEYKIEESNNSVIFIKQNHVFYKSDAIIEITKLINGWPKIALIGIVLPKFIRNFLYDLIAKNRYKIFGKKIACALPSKKNEHKFIT